MQLAPPRGLRTGFLPLAPRPTCRSGGRHGVVRPEGNRAVTEEELNRLLAGTESEAVEFKPALLSRREIAEYAVGIGNSGGGRLVMGVTDKVPRRVQPLPPLSDGEIQQLRRSVYDSAQIHVHFENLPTTGGNVVVVTIPARPRGQVLHTRDGKYLVRVGEDLRGLTVPELDAIRQEAGIELTAVPSLPVDSAVRAAGIEELRALLAEAGAASDLAGQSDRDLLRSLGVVSPDGATLLSAGVLLVGKDEAIRSRFPHAQWQFFRMVSDTDYDQVQRGCDCLTVALKRLRELIDASNPVVTIPGWLVHPEFPRYPRLAVRELLANALAHRDYAAPGCVTVKLYPDRLELSNPGGFPGDVTPDNILHHPSTPRYPTLFGALARMRLANAANLGVPRVYRELLSEGKEPPSYVTTGQTVSVVVKGQEPRPEFLRLVHENPGLDVDDLLVLHYLSRHREVNSRQAGELCQRAHDRAGEHLARLVAHWGLLEAGGGSGRGRYYRLSRRAYEALGGTLSYYVDQRLGVENAKARVLSALRDRPLSNADIREITQMNRHQAVRLMDSLRDEGLVDVEGSKRGARWHLRTSSPK